VLEIIPNYAERQKRERAQPCACEHKHTEQISLIKTSKKEEKLIIAMGMVGRTYLAPPAFGNTHIAVANYKHASQITRAALTAGRI
jgi:hypothetical protein